MTARTMLMSSRQSSCWPSASRWSPPYYRRRQPLLVHSLAHSPIRSRFDFTLSLFVSLSKSRTSHPLNLHLSFSPAIGCLHKRRNVGDFDCHWEEAKKWRVSMPPLGLVIELSDPNTNEDDDHDLDSAVANAVNSASSSIESSSKKRRTSEARVAN